MEGGGGKIKRRERRFGAVLNHRTAPQPRIDLFAGLAELVRNRWFSFGVSLTNTSAHTIERLLPLSRSNEAPKYVALSADHITKRPLFYNLKWYEKLTSL